MKVLWINQTSINQCISNTSRIEVPKFLKNFGHQVVMVVPEVGWRRSSRISWWDKVHVIRVPFPRFQIPFFLIQLFFLLPFLLRVYQPDVVITDYPSVPAVALLAFGARLKMLKLRFILDVRSCPVQIVGFGGEWRRFQYFVSLTLAKYTYQGLTVITEELKREIVRDLKINPDLIGQWSSGASIELFNPEGVAEKSKAEFGLENRFVVMYHGTFRPERGIETAIKAVSNLARKGYPIGLFVLGDGPLLQTLNDVLRRSQADNCVVIHPPVDYEEVPSFIKMADIGINIPRVDIAWWKSQSFLKVMEYLSMEKPVVLSNIIAHQEVVGTQQPFVSFVNDNDIEDVEQAILHFYDLRQDIMKLGKNARQLICSQFTWENQARKLENYLLEETRTII